MDCLAALCQIKPTLGDLDRNLDLHLEWIETARAEKAELLLFPELSLTGYSLRDLASEVARPLTDDHVQRIVARSKDCSIAFGIVEESDDHRFFNSMVFAEDGEILQVHRKVFLPTYGIFEEGRYFAADEQFALVNSKYGKFGILTCEDAWHLAAGWLYFLQGADALLIPSASPARGVDTDGPDLSSQGAWDALNRSLSLFFQSWVLHCNRVGFEDGAMFSGCSSVHTPFGYEAVRAADDQEELVLHRIDSDPLKRARTFTPLRRDGRPDIVRRHLARLLNDPDALAACDES